MDPTKIRAISEEALMTEIEAADLRVTAEWTILRELLTEAERRVRSAESPLGRWLYERRMERRG